MGRKIKRTLALAAAAAMSAVQFGASGLFNSTAADTASGATSFPFVIEGEDMEGAGDPWTAIYQTQIPGFSGKGFWYLTASPASFEVTVPEDGMYSITVHGAQILNKEGRQQAVKVNGAKYITQAAYSEEWRDYDFGMVRLNKGVNTIEFISEYGYMAVDYVTVSEAEFSDLTIADDTPIDAKATPETKSLMKFLKSVYGKNILSGQQEIYGGGHPMTSTIRYDAAANKCVDSDGKEYTFDEADVATADDGSKFVWKCFDEDGQQYSYNQQNRNYTWNDYDYEMKYLKNHTGKLPAIRGFDFGSYCPCYAWDDGVANRMIDWAKNKNGIVTASWHINVPTNKADYTLGEPLDFSKTTYSEKTDFVTANCMVKGTMEYDYFQLCMKNLAAELKKLQDAGVPVIFRPFHEAEGNPSRTEDPIDGSGAWFWWSKEGAEVYNKLWAFLQDTLMNEYGLHNLIYEQNLYAWSEYSAAWYSGDDKVDIVGYDKYNVVYNRHDGKTSGANYDAESRIFYSLYNWVKGHKMVSMPENDSVPSIQNMKVEHANWLYFCPWYDSDQEPFVSGEKYQDADNLKEVYISDYCLTLDELPKDLYKGGSSVTDPTKPSQPENVLYGDANCSGEIKMNDAVLIMQAIANNDIYGVGGTDENALTDKGAINADCYEPGSDLTNMDALAVQKFLIGTETLPIDPSK